MVPAEKNHFFRVWKGGRHDKSGMAQERHPTVACCHSHVRALQRATALTKAVCVFVSYYFKTFRVCVACSKEVQKVVCVPYLAAAHRAIGATRGVP